MSAPTYFENQICHFFSQNELLCLLTVSRINSKCLPTRKQPSELSNPDGVFTVR